MKILTLISLDLGLGLPLILSSVWARLSKGAPNFLSRNFATTGSSDLLLSLAMVSLFRVQGKVPVRIIFDNGRTTLGCLMIRKTCERRKRETM